MKKRVFALVALLSTSMLSAGAVQTPASTAAPQTTSAPGQPNGSVQALENAELKAEAEADDLIVMEEDEDLEENALLFPTAENQ